MNESVAERAANSHLPIKCTHCGEPATRIVQGVGYCKEHLRSAQKHQIHINNLEDRGKRIDPLLTEKEKFDQWCREMRRFRQ